MVLYFHFGIVWLLHYQKTKYFSISLKIMFPTSHLHSENCLHFMFISGSNVKILGIFLMIFFILLANTFIRFAMIISEISTMQFQMISYKALGLAIYLHTKRIHTIVSAAFKHRSNPTVPLVRIRGY